MKPVIPVLLLAIALLPGCIIVGGSSSPSSRGYGTVEKITMDRIIADNTLNRVGDEEATVLARYPAETVSLVRASREDDGRQLTVYRVFARERHRSTQFVRYLVFHDGRLSLLTSDSRDLPRPVTLEVIN
jgi:hypothetical protein